MTSERVATSDELASLASVLEDQAKRALDGGRMNVEVDARYVIPQLAATLRRLAASETATTGMLDVLEDARDTVEALKELAGETTYAAPTLLRLDAAIDALKNAASASGAISGKPDSSGGQASSPVADAAPSSAPSAGGVAIDYYCGPCNWSGRLAKPESGHPKCPECEAYLSEAPVDDLAAMDRARRLWHRQCGLDGSPCPTKRECEAFDIGFKAALLHKASAPSSARATSDLEQKLDAISKALDYPSEAWRMAGCDVLAHAITDLVANFGRLQAQMGKVDATLDELGAPGSGDWEGLNVALSRRGRIKRLVSANAGNDLAMKVAHIVMGFRNEDSAGHYDMLRDIEELIAASDRGAESA